MAQPNEEYSFLRGDDYGDLLLQTDVIQKVYCVDQSNSFIIKCISEAIEVIEKQLNYVDDSETALKYISIKGQVLRSLENARQLMAIYQGTCISHPPRALPPTQEDMSHFLDRWRKKRSNS